MFLSVYINLLKINSLNEINIDENHILLAMLYNYFFDKAIFNYLLMYLQLQIILITFYKDTFLKINNTNKSLLH